MEEQLLSELINYERFDLERTKKELVISLLHDKKQLAEIEDTILQQIEMHKYDILVRILSLAER